MATGGAVAISSSRFNWPMPCSAEMEPRRLRTTYVDLAADPRYTAAVQFFQNDLYSGADYSRRDADLALTAREKRKHLRLRRLHSNHRPTLGQGLHQPSALSHQR